MPRAKSQSEDPMAAEAEALKAEAMAAPEKPKAAETPAEVQENLTATLLATIASMQRQIAELSAPKEKPAVELPPPPPARKDRPHIMVYVSPDTCVRREVTQEYIDNKLPGWDGVPVKGYIYHEQTLRVR